MRCRRARTRTAGYGWPDGRSRRSRRRAPPPPRRPPVLRIPPPSQAYADPLGELLGRLGAGDRVPALGLDQLEELRVAMRGADPQLAALPLAEPHLAQLRDD